MADLQGTFNIEHNWHVILQFCFIPFYILSLLSVKINENRVPYRWIPPFVFLLLSVCTFAAIKEFSLKRLEYPIVVSAFKNDHFSTEKRKLIRKIRDTDTQLSSVITESPVRIETIKNSQDFFDRYTHTKIILSTKETPSLTFFFKKESPLLIGSISTELAQSNLYKNLAIVEQIPSIEFKNSLVFDKTNSFVISLMLTSFMNEDNPLRRILSLKQIFLSDVYSRNNDNSTLNFKSYLLWLSGNLYLKHALMGNSFGSEIQCSLKSFQKSLHYISKKSSPELYSAILNNFGIAEVLNFFSDSYKKSFRNGLTKLSLASKINRNTPNEHIDAVEVSRSNLKHLYNKNPIIYSSF
jgi:hypothetical protein